MSNLVQIVYGKAGKYPRVLINGEEISRYLELSDRIFDDVFRWADQFYETIDGELAEGYRLELTGHPFHVAAMQSAMSASQYCEGVSFVPLEHRIPIEDKYAFACKLNQKYQVADVPQSTQIRFRCREPERFDELELKHVLFGVEESPYTIAFQKDAGAEEGGKYHVIISDVDRIRKERGRTILYVTRKTLPLLIDYLNIYHIRLDMIENVFSKINGGNVDPATRLELDAYTKEEYRIMVQDLPAKLESGQRAEVKYEYFPKCFEAPDVVITSDNPNVLAVENGEVVAREKGTASVRLSNREGKEFALVHVEVEKHNYATGLTVILPEMTMDVGTNMQLRCIPTPNDAEDAEEITCSVDNPNVAVVSGRTEIYAVGPGRVCVTVSTPRVSSKVYISVYAPANAVAVSSQNIELTIGEEATIFCAPVPEDARPKPNLIWLCRDTNVIRIVRYDSNRCVIRPVNEGTAKLVCAIEKTSIHMDIKVTVSKPKGCYVATAVYGSYDCPEVWVLRRFRDDYLAKSWAGRMFIKCYYGVSPTVVRLFGKQKWFNNFWKNRLDVIVNKLKSKGYKETPYKDC